MRDRPLSINFVTSTPLFAFFSFARWARGTFSPSFTPIRLPPEPGGNTLARPPPPFRFLTSLKDWPQALLPLKDSLVFPIHPPQGPLTFFPFSPDNSRATIGSPPLFFPLRLKLVELAPRLSLYFIQIYDDVPHGDGPPFPFCSPHVTDPSPFFDPTRETC